MMGLFPVVFQDEQIKQIMYELFATFCTYLYVLKYKLHMRIICIALLYPVSTQHTVRIRYDGVGNGNVFCVI